MQRLNHVTPLQDYENSHFAAIAILLNHHPGLIVNDTPYPLTLAQRQPLIFEAEPSIGEPLPKQGLRRFEAIFVG